MGEGAESVIGGAVFTRGADMKPKNSGQGGVQLRYRLENFDAELGLYAARYHDKTPQLYLTLDPAFNPSNVEARIDGVGSVRALFSAA